MAASVIPISLDSSEESVGSHVPRMILFGTIPVIIPVIPVVLDEVPIVHVDPLVAPEVGAVSITSPVGVLDLVDYSSSNFDPSEDSLPPAPELPMVSPFLFFDDSNANSESKPAEQRPKRHESLAAHDAMVLRWRDRVASRPSSPSISSSTTHLNHHLSFPLLLLLPHPRFFNGRHLIRPYSLSDTSSVHSSGFDASGQTHSGPSTRVASSRLIYPLVMTPRYSEAFRH
ncbi:hypothetical protein Tco_1537892 [Tanacetum coccineum]